MYFESVFTKSVIEYFATMQKEDLSNKHIFLVEDIVGKYLDGFLCSFIKRNLPMIKTGKQMYSCFLLKLCFHNSQKK